MNLSTLTIPAVRVFRRRLPLTLCILTLTVSSAPGQALEVVGKQLEIYGTLHPSLDYLDSDVSQTLADADPDDKLSAGDTSLSFNSSKLGVRGEISTDISGLSAVYQLEQNVNPDGKSNDTLNTRNSFAGLRTAQWTVLAGRHDSLFKSLALRHSLLKHSVADRGAILGAGAIHGNQMDIRAENMILGRYYLPLSDSRLELQAQYSPDAVKSSGRVDNNKREMFALAAEWKSAQRIFAFAWDHWANLSIGGTPGEVNAVRALWKETAGQLTTAVIVESIDHTLNNGDAGEMDRNAIAVQARYAVAGFRYLGQIMAADDYADVSDSGAVMVSLGIEKPLSASTRIYAM